MPFKRNTKRIIKYDWMDLKKVLLNLGNMQAEIDKTKQFIMPNTQKTAVEILWQLDTPVREDIYRYIVEEWFFENDTRSSRHY